MPEWFKGSREDSVRAAMSSSQISYILVLSDMRCPGFRWLGVSRARSTGIAMKTVLRGWKSGFFRSFLGAKYRN